MGDGAQKWAAAVMGEKFLDLEKTEGIGLAYLLLDAYRFGTDEVAAEAPAVLSGEVMEDVQGKKIVFRSGWKP